MGYEDPVELGTVLTLPEDTENVPKQYTVVGTVQDPQHFSTDKESSTAGDGQLDAIVFLPDGSLTTDYYTVCYIKAENADLYDNYSDEYQAAVDAVAEKLKAIQSRAVHSRRAELIEDANAKLTDARAEYDSQKAEAERQFAEADSSWRMHRRSWTAPKPSWTRAKRSLPPSKKALPDTMQSGAGQAGEQRGAGAGI